MGAKAVQPTAKELYELDFFEWTARNAELLRARRFNEADIERIAEEIEDMGRSQRHELRSRLRVLLVHLLKWQFQPQRRGESWIGTIDEQRAEIGDLLRDAPSLRGMLRDDLGDVYHEAARMASRQTGVSRESFPRSCPFALDQILDIEFFPG